jgi:hypothetical protein
MEVEGLKIEIKEMKDSEEEKEDELLEEYKMRRS